MPAVKPTTTTAPMMNHLWRLRMSRYWRSSKRKDPPGVGFGGSAPTHPSNVTSDGCRIETYAARDRSTRSRNPPRPMGVCPVEEERGRCAQRTALFTRNFLLASGRAEGCAGSGEGAEKGSEDRGNEALEEG